MKLMGVLAFLTIKYITNRLVAVVRDTVFFHNSTDIIVARFVVCVKAHESRAIQLVDQNILATGVWAGSVFEIHLCFHGQFALCFFHLGFACVEESSEGRDGDGGGHSSFIFYTKIIILCLSGFP